MIGSSAGKYSEFSSNRSKIEVIQRSPNQTRGRTPWILNSSERGVGGLLEQRDPRLGDQFLAEQVRRVRADRDLNAGDGLGGVPVRREVVRADLEMDLGGRTGRLRHDRVGDHVQPFDPVDADLQVLAAGGEDLLVEQRVAGVLADAGQRHVLGPQRRQDADHRQLAADLRRALLRVVQGAAYRLLEGAQPVVRQRPRSDVDLDVELAQLGDELGVGDRLQHLGVAHGRLAVAVDQIELDLQAGHRSVEVERRLGQHAGQRVETGPHLLPVPGCDLHE